VLLLEARKRVICVRVVGSRVVVFVLWVCVRARAIRRKKRRVLCWFSWQRERKRELSSSLRALALALSSAHP
jgi:hypothetical protein